MQEDIKDNNRSGDFYWKSLFGLLMVCAVVSRTMLMKKWLIHYFDADQALMWNATVAYAHFMFPEPFFWGQAYGFMTESIVAVPLYWLHVPLNIALPVATIVTGIISYLFVALLLLKNGHPRAACLVMAAYLLMKG